MLNILPFYCKKHASVTAVSASAFDMTSPLVVLVSWNGETGSDDGTAIELLIAMFSISSPTPFHWPSSHPHTSTPHTSTAFISPSHFHPPTLQSIGLHLTLHLHRTHFDLPSFHPQTTSIPHLPLSPTPHSPSSCPTSLCHSGVEHGSTCIQHMWHHV